MENAMQIFESDNLSELRILQENTKDYMGYFYVIEWNDFVKIGSTSKPYQRICALLSNANHYGGVKTGRVAVSRPHTNYRANEKALHRYFSKENYARTELFHVRMDTVIAALPEILSLKDESAELGEKNGRTVECLKEVTLSNSEQFAWGTLDDVVNLIEELRDTLTEEGVAPHVAFPVMNTVLKHYGFPAMPLPPRKANEAPLVK